MLQASKLRDVMAQPMLRSCKLLQKEGMSWCLNKAGGCAKGNATPLSQHSIHCLLHLDKRSSRLIRMALRFVQMQSETSLMLLYL